MLTAAEAEEMARRLLAIEVQEPVAWTDAQELRDVEKHGCGYLFTVNPIMPNADPRRIIKLYAAPQPVAVPDDDGQTAFVIPEPATLTNISQLCPLDVNLSQTDFASGWNDCRKFALTQGRVPPIVKGVHAVAQGWNACRAKMLQPSSGVLQLPDGWKLVPVEPTAEMISSGIAAHYERSQIQIHDRPARGPMECAYVAMLSAAPVNPEFTTLLVGEVVAWHHPNHERNVDFRWLDFNVEPGTKLYAIKQERS